MQGLDPQAQAMCWLGQSGWQCPSEHSPSLWPLKQLHIARHSSKAPCRSHSGKIQLEKAYKKEKDPQILNAHAVLCAFTHFDSGDWASHPCLAQPCAAWDLWVLTAAI